jgi:Uma2 family endonuclease
VLGWKTGGTVMSTAQKYFISPQEYLERERKAEFRSEYFHGEVFAMSGGSPRHSLIKTNLVAELRNKLKGRPCTAYDVDLRVKVEATGLYTYPDASVVCGALEFDDERRDTIVNPTLLAEVLSPSSEAYDRGRKFNNYRKVESLKEYLLVSQEFVKVELFSRNDDGTWNISDFDQLTDNVEIPSIGIAISLAEIYDKVDFASPTDVNSTPPA